jgi:hypothetical protein
MFIEYFDKIVSLRLNLLSVFLAEQYAIGLLECLAQNISFGNFKFLCILNAQVASRFCLNLVSAYPTG